MTYLIIWGRKYSQKTMYELVILAHLMRGSAHGYLIARILNDIVGPYTRISNGRLYPLLAKLEKSGLLVLNSEGAAEQHGDRQLRSFTITAAGKQRFHELMMDTTLNPGDYQRLFLHKSTNLDLLRPGERLRLINHYANYCQAHILHLTAEADDIVQQSAGWNEQGFAIKAENIVQTLHHMLDVWQLELRWAGNLRERELARSQAAEDLQ